MSDAGAIGVILDDYRSTIKKLDTQEPAEEYKYALHVIDLIIKDIEKQGIDLDMDY